MAIWRPRAIPLLSFEHHAPRPADLPSPVPSPADGPSISLVTPSFNQAEYLAATIESILSQEYPRLEYVVRDGGSTDGTAAVLDRYRDRLDGCYSGPDGGQADAIATGFAETSGEVMGWLNSDDLLTPGALATVGRFFRDHPEVDVVYGCRIMIDAAGREVGRWALPPHDGGALKWLDYVPQETLFWRRSLYDAVGGIDPSKQFALDWDLLLRFLDAGATFRRLPRFQGLFRVHEAQKTSAQGETVGRPEIAALRQQYLGFVPSRGRVALRMAGYLARHLTYHAAMRAGLWPPAADAVSSSGIDASPARPARRAA
ncbi:MAG: glycosyltransferase family 2 protein [Planctomycetota bacterium]